MRKHTKVIRMNEAVNGGNENAEDQKEREGDSSSLPAKEETSSNTKEEIEKLLTENDSAKYVPPPGSLQEEYLRLLESDPDSLISRFADVGSRSNIGIRFNVKLPEDVYGEWIAKDEACIAEAKSLGFVMDTKYAVNNALHNDGTNVPTIGDAVFMVMPKKLKMALDAANAIRFRKHHGVARQLPEETEFENMIKDVGLSLQYKSQDINESIQEKVSATEIHNSIKGMVT